MYTYFLFIEVLAKGLDPIEINYIIETIKFTSY